MIKIEQCRQCGRPLLIHSMAGLNVRLEPDHLDVQGATTALLGGRGLWRITPTSVSPATNVVLEALGRLGTTVGPHVVQEHRCRADARQGGCTAAGAPVAPFAGKESNPAPKGRQSPPVAPSTRSSDRPSRGSTARRAERPTFEASRRRETPRSVDCTLCGQPLDDPATAAMIHLGATLIDAFHTGECPA